MTPDEHQEIAAAVASQLPAVVADQLPEPVADQLPAPVADQLPNVVRDQLVDAVAGSAHFIENKSRIDQLDRIANSTAQESFSQREILDHQRSEFVKERARTNHRLLVVFLIVILAFILLAIRTEINAATIRSSNHDTAVTAWEVCQSTITGRKSINANNQALGAALTAFQPQTPGLIKLEAIISSGELSIPVCGPRP